MTHPPVPSSQPGPQPWYPPPGHRPPPQPARRPVLGLVLAPLVMVVALVLAGPVLMRQLFATDTCEGQGDALDLTLCYSMVTVFGLGCAVAAFVAAALLGVLALRMRWWWPLVTLAALLVLGAVGLGLTRVLDGAPGLTFAAPHLAALAAPPRGTPRPRLVVPAVLAAVAAVVGVIVAPVLL